jgi:glycosyltransferase involved in cell wall biosynthesis
MKEKFVRKRLKKAVGYHLVIRKVLHSISKLHFATRMEKEKSSWLTAGVDSEVVPLPVISVATLPKSRAIEELRELLPSVAEKRLVLFLGRLSWLKGIDLLCEATSTVIREADNVLLVIAGHDDEGIGWSIAEQCSALGIDSHTAMIGGVDPARRAALLSLSEVFVLPSLSENFSMALVEAMSAGVPVVTTTSVGASEYVKESGAGMVVQRSADELASAILNLLRSDKERMRMGNAGKETVIAEFSPDKVADRLLHVYREMTSGQ